MLADDVIAAGGIAPRGVPATAAVPLDAICFEHPAMPDRVVVRLSGNAAAVTTEMELAGFTVAQKIGGVGQERKRTLGFPGQALRLDPKNGRYALAVMKGFTIARKRVATKPGHAKEAFQELADKLGRAAPHFLPGFWEEAGRAFLQGGNIAMAAMAFEKARQAEREHGLTVDDEERADTFLEFALAGALSVKSLLAWPAELRRTRGAAVAFDRFFELALRRTLGGRAPWASLPKDLREAAKAAKRDPVAEEQRFVRAVLDSAAIRKAPIGFWGDVAGSVEKLAADPGVRDSLARLFPTLSGEEDIATWLGLLERWGVIEKLAADGIPGGLAGWMGKALTAWDEAPKALFTLCERLAPRLVAEGTPVAVFPEDDWSRVEAVDAFDLLLEAGVKLEPIHGDGRFYLEGWAGSLDDEDEEADGKDGVQAPEAGAPAAGARRHRDPIDLAAHPRLGKGLQESARGALDNEEFQEVAVGMEAFREVRRKHLVDTLARFSAGGLVDVEEAIEALTGSVPRSLLQEFPDEAAPSAEIGVAGALARTLRGGVFDELGWDTFDEVYGELSRPVGGNTPDVEVKAIAPFVVVSDGRQARVLGPGGLLGSFDLRIPKGRSPELFLWADGQLLTTWRSTRDWSVREGCWSGRPQEILTITWEGRGHDPLTLAWPGGGALVGGQRVRAGESHIHARKVFQDAEGVWVVEEAKIRRIDPETGKLGAAEAPAFLEDREGVAPDLDGAMYHPAWSEGSPLGAGPYGWASFWLDADNTADVSGWLTRHAPRALRTVGEATAFHVGISRDGRSVVSEKEPLGLLSWPGSDHSRVVVEEGWRGVGVVDSDGTRLMSLEDESFHAGTPTVLPLALWHHFRPRDESASQRLRQVDATLARRLLDACRESGTDEARLQKVVREILGPMHPRLEQGVIGIVRHAGSQQARVEAWKSEQEEVEETVEGPRDEELRVALSGLTDRYGDDDTSVVAVLQKALLFLDGGPGDLPETDFAWWDWLAFPGAPLFVLLSPATTEDEKETIKTLLPALAAPGWNGLRRLMVTVPKTAGWLKWVDSWGDKEVAERWTHVEGGSRYLCRKEEHDEEKGLVTVELLGCLGDRSMTGAGEMELPPGVTVTSDTRITTEGAPILAALVALPTLPVNEEVYAAIVAPTGLSRGEAAALWAGLRKLGRWESDPLGREAREILGLKLGDAKAARDTLSAIAMEKRWEVYHRAISTWVASVPAGAALDPATLAGHLGTAWVGVFGRQEVVEELLQAKARQDFPGGEGVEALRLVAGVESAEVLHNDGDWGMDEDGDVVRKDGNATVFDGDTLGMAVAAIGWIYGNTAGEDPLRRKLPLVLAAVDARMASPRLLFRVASGYDKAIAGWFKRFDGVPFPIYRPDTARDEDETPEAERPRSKEREGILAIGDKDGARVAIRPVALGDGSREEVGRILSLDGGYSDGTVWEALKLWLSPEYRALATEKSEGWPQDPRRSAPDTLRAVATRLGLDDDAATLYLQLLALYNPTRQNVLGWNGWKPAAYTRAAAALVEKDLVVEAKRARAGREHFLPGGWLDRRSGSLPMEEWKAGFYGGVNPPLGNIVPLMPFGELFRAAWGKVLAGEGPRYEKRRG